MATSPIVYFNGQYQAKDTVTVSPDDRGFLFGDGVYEVIRSYQGRLFRLPEHLARLNDGLRALEIDGVHADVFAEVAPRLLTENGLQSHDATIYIQVTRGVAPRSHYFPDPAPAPTVYATPNPFRPRGDATVGVAAITAPDMRWARCDIKSVNLLANCMAHQAARVAGAGEAILIRDGVALEGTASSLFGVFDGEVRTAPKSNYILPSITREAAITLCHDDGIPCRETPIFAHQLARADELFLAGTTVEIMPIVTVDGRPVGAGRPGPIQQRLATLFRRETDAA